MSPIMPLAFSRESPTPSLILLSLLFLELTGVVHPTPQWENLYSFTWDIHVCKFTCWYQRNSPHRHQNGLACLSSYTGSVFVELWHPAEQTQSCLTPGMLHCMPKQIQRARLALPPLWARSQRGTSTNTLLCVYAPFAMGPKTVLLTRVSLPSHTCLEENPRALCPFNRLDVIAR